MAERIAGVDVARGVASILMVQGHAFHGWVAPEHHDAAYRFTRVLGTIPLPAFLLLAGAAVELRLEAAVRKQESAATVRRALIRRGLQILLYGYLVSGAYALIDGWQGVQTFLRSDVLHVIGLSIAVSGAFLPKTGVVDRDARKHQHFRVIALTFLATMLCPWISAFSPFAPEVIAPLVALVADRPPYGAMPLVPLYAWFGMGMVLLRLLRSEPLRAAGHKARTATAIAGAPLLILATGLVVSVVGAWVFEFGTHAWVTATDDVLTRRHPAVWFNVLDLGCRGFGVLCAGGLLSVALGPRVRSAFVTLGRGSLVAYIVHIPFCYGRMGGSLVGNCSMAEASGFVVALVAFSWGCVYARDALLARVRLGRASAPAQ